jgi:hypothetical protein
MDAARQKSMLIFFWLVVLGSVCCICCLPASFHSRLCLSYMMCTADRAIPSSQLFPLPCLHVILGACLIN